MTERIVGTLGKILNADESRDAIHIAVIPCVASTGLNPGDRISITQDGSSSPSSEPIGIVDPFLLVPVQKGQRFWLWLNPGSITSLRHCWRHPAIADEVSTRQSEAMAWIEEQAEYFGMTGQELIAHAKMSIDSKWGNAIVEQDSESWRDHWYEICDEFWGKFEIATGLSRGDSPTLFCCSC